MQRNGRHGLAALEQERQGRKVGSRGTHPPAQAKPGQPFVGDANEPTRRHEQMLAGQELRQGEGLLVLRQTGRGDRTGVVAFATYLAAAQSFSKNTPPKRKIEE